MNASEFEEAYEDDDGPRTRAEQELGEAILSAPIRMLGPRPPVTVSPDTPVAEAIRLMLDESIGAVLVVSDDKAVGIFTERDVLRRVVSGGLDRTRPVRDVMTEDPETLGLDDGIAFALNRMIIGGFRHVPIVDEKGAPQAVLSLREVVAFVVSLLPDRFLTLPPEPIHEARSTDGG